MFSGGKPSQLGAQPTLGRGPGRLPRLQHHPPPPTNSSSSNSSNLQIWIHRNICIILVNISSHFDAWICHPEAGYNKNNLIQHPDPDLESGHISSHLDIWTYFSERKIFGYCFNISKMFLVLDIFIPISLIVRREDDGPDMFGGNIGRRC